MSKWLAIAVVALAGCAANTPRTHYYTLDAVARSSNSAAGSTAATSTVRVSVWQVNIPEVVDRSQLVVRSAPNRVEIADFHRWAEPLRLGVARVVADDIAARLGDGFTVVSGQPGGLKPDVRVSLDVQKFEAVPGEGVTVEALWTVRPATGEARTGRSLAEERAPGQDYAAIAAAFSRALARIADDVGAEIQTRTP
jgi:uncharacterized lipoprotein YmbA